MKTEKLYYKDAYIKEFKATVLSCEHSNGGYDIILDKTAFFPEEGGQTSDKGLIDGKEVFDVREKDGVIHHYCKEAHEVGMEVFATINFDERFEKMQCHTAEHIISGLFHSMYGIENTGFHLGALDVTMDTSEVVTREMMAEVERIANQAVFDNVKIETIFPTKEELPTLSYRSKLDITDNVRIVNIGKYDSCACCAPHVNFTGEIGFIKFIDSVKHKSGSRIRILAGIRAYDYISRMAKEASGISVMLSAPVLEISEEVKRVLDSRDALEYKISELGKSMAELIAESLEYTEGNRVLYYPSLDLESLRTLANKAFDKTGGILLLLTGEERAYKYILTSSAPDFQKVVKDANSILNGKGGGRAPMATGTYGTSLEDIKKYFCV